MFHSSGKYGPLKLTHRKSCSAYFIEKKMFITLKKRSVRIESVATYRIGEQLMLSYQTCVTFPSLSYLLTLCCLITFCRLIKLLLPYQSFGIFPGPKMLFQGDVPEGSDTSYLPTPPLGQDMTQGQILSGV